MTWAAWCTNSPTPRCSKSATWSRHGGGGALKLEAPIPLDLYLIDLDGGLTGVAGEPHRVTVDQIASTPLRAAP